MELIISGIKCDTQHCNWRDDNVSFSEYPKYVNKPCPVCGGNLLTEKDYKTVLNQYKAVAILDKVERVLVKLNPFNWFKKPKEYVLTKRFNNDGSSITTIKENK